ncbi:MAG: toll/interleukin-1 receptor domain-containing protein [Gallionella sp.]
MSDIFISYAHIDNQPFSEGEKGWISHLINHLRNELSRKMGRAENYELWMDFRLKGSDELTPAIEDQLVKTHALVILLSPGWLASEWCQRELKVFAQHLAHPAGRVFVVELDQIALKDKPPILHDLLTYRFWQKNDQDRIKQLGYPVPLKEHEAYYDRLRDLSNDLATSLKAKQVAKPAVTTQTESTVQPAQATVYVAPVNDALYEQRASLISNLRQLGIAALPLNNDWDEIKFAADAALCSHFVQLLDAGWSYGIPLKQHALAMATGKPIVQWRETKLEFSAAREEQKSLLLGATVMATSLTEFTRHIQEKVFPKPPEPIPARDPEDKLVFVHACPNDIVSAREVANELGSKGYTALLPIYQGTASDINQKIERNFKRCDVLLMLHRQAPADLVEDCLLDARRQIKQREQKPHVLICQGEQADELGIVLAGALTLPCREKFETRCLDLFLQEVS